MSRNTPRTIKLVDFSFGPHVSPVYPPSTMRWHKVRDEKELGPDDTVVYTNVQLEKAAEHEVGRRIAWLLESRGVSWPAYEYVEDNLGLFDRVLTYDESLLAKDPERCQFAARGGTYLKPEDVRIYPKSRLVSFISSKKKFTNWSAVGHGLRQHLYWILTHVGGALGARMTRAGIKDRIDCYGSITGTVLPDKLDSLRDYKFQIAVENMIHDTYFTEKLIDCFATGTIPIYRGTREVCRFFNPRGILFFETLEDLTALLEGLSEEDYDERLDAVRENFELCREFLCPEDWMVRHTDLAEL